MLFLECSYFPRSPNSLDPYKAGEEHVDYPAEWEATQGKLAVKSIRTEEPSLYMASFFFSFPGDMPVPWPVLIPVPISISKKNFKNSKIFH